MSCPFKYFLKFKNGIVKIDNIAKGFDLEFGQRVHSGLEYIYTLIAKLPQEQKAIDSFFDGYEHPEDEKDKTKNGGVKLITDYTNKWFEMDKKTMEILDIENILEIDIDNHKYLVKLDTAVKVNGNIYSLEHKTTSQIKYNYFDQYNLDCQITAQSAALSQKYGACSGVIINAMSVKNYVRKTKDKEPGLHTEFQRRIQNRNRHQVEDFKQNVKSWIKDIERCEEDEFWRKACNSQSCSGYRGCPYSNICETSVGMEIDEQILDTMYTVVDTKAYLSTKPEGGNEE